MRPADKRLRAPCPRADRRTQDGNAVGLAEVGTALRTDGRMLIRFLILCAGLFLFARIGSEVVEGDTLSFDRAIITALRQPGDLAVPIGPRWLMLMMRDITALGGVVVLTLITAIVAGYLLVLRRRATALFVIVAAVSGSLLGTLLKGLFQRPRPDIVSHLVDVSTTSFPSGHAMNSAIIYLTLGSLLARTHEDRRIRIYILTVSILLTLIIGSSRVYPRRPLAHRCPRGLDGRRDLGRALLGRRAAVAGAGRDRTGGGVKKGDAALLRRVMASRHFRREGSTERSGRRAARSGARLSDQGNTSRAKRLGSRPGKAMPNTSFATSR